MDKGRWQPATRGPADFGGSAAAIPDSVDPNVGEYLGLLHERNRFMRTLKAKSRDEIEAEKKEQGFSVYLNGANTPRRPNAPPSRPRPRPPVAADMGSPPPPRRASGYAAHAAAVTTTAPTGGGTSLPTLPSREALTPRRRGWNQSGHVKIKAQDGDTLIALAPRGATAEDYDHNHEENGHVAPGRGPVSDASSPGSMAGEVDEQVRMSAASVDDPAAYEVVESDTSDGKDAGDTASDRDGTGILSLSNSLSFSLNDSGMLRRHLIAGLSVDDHEAIFGTGDDSIDAGTDGGLPCAPAPPPVETRGLTGGVTDEPLINIVGRGDDAEHDDADMVIEFLNPERERTVVLSDYRHNPGIENVAARVDLPVEKTRALLHLLTRLEHFSSLAKPAVDVHQPLLFIRVRLLCVSSWSQWENQGAVDLGLNELQFFDGNGAAAVVAPDDVSVDGALSTTVARLVNGMPRTTNEHNMWKTELRIAPLEPVTVCVKLPAAFALRRVVVWNYNRPNCEAFGVKEMALYVGSRRVWFGIVPRAPGRSNSNVSLVIDVPLDVLKSPSTAPLTFPTAELGPLRAVTADAAEPSRTAATLAQDLSFQKGTVADGKLALESTNAGAVVAPLWLTQAATRTRLTTPPPPTPTPDWLEAASLRDPAVFLPSPIVFIEQASAKFSRGTPPPLAHSIESLAEARKTARRGTAFVVAEEDSAVFNAASQSRSPRGRRATPLSTHALPADYPAALAAKSNSAPDAATTPRHGRRATLGLSEVNVSAPVVAQNAGDTQRHELPSASVAALAADAARPSLDILEDQLLRDVPVSQQGGPMLHPRDPVISSSGKRHWSVLQKSWDALSQFKHVQAGRLCASSSLVMDSLADSLAVTGELPATDALPFPVEVAHLPSGQSLQIIIHSTWGDAHYVGLSGIEVYTTDGEEIGAGAEIDSDSELPRAAHDPRVVGNLLRDPHRTCNEVDMWLAPFAAGVGTTVTLRFPRAATIAAIRVYNYNASRAHSLRGARQVTMRVGGLRVFHGELARGPGHTHHADQTTYGELILFTTDPAILAKVSANDGACREESRLMLPVVDPGPELPARPQTADRLTDIWPHPHRATSAHDSWHGALARAPLVLPATPAPAAACGLPAPAGSARIECAHVEGRVLEFDFVDTWGDAHYLGLTELAVFNEYGVAIVLADSQLSAQPRDLNDLPAGGEDVRTLDKLIDGHNVTTDDRHMWLIPFTPGKSHKLQVSFQRLTKISRIALGNYNKSLEDTTRGVRRMLVRLDGALLSPSGGWWVRKALGHARFNNRQAFDTHSIYAPPAMCDDEGETAHPEKPGKSLNALVANYVMPLEPCGLHLAIRFLTTCGDAHYLGLNGLRLVDRWGNVLPLVAGRNVFAVPSSMHDEGDSAGPRDCRTLDKLFDGVNTTADDRHMWLVPFTPNKAVTLDIIWDTPVALGAIMVWNYAKTPTRGARHVQVYVDGGIVFDGRLAPAPSRISTDFHETILFTARTVVAATEQHFVLRGEASLAFDQQNNRMTEPSFVPDAPGVCPAGDDHAPQQRPQTRCAGRGYVQWRT